MEQNALSDFLLVQNRARNVMEGDSIAKTVNSPNNETYPQGNLKLWQLN